MKRIETDSMPVEVATELLTDPKARVTNRMRKNCRDARTKYFASEQERKPVQGKLERRAHDKPLVSLGRTLRRVCKRRAKLQAAYEAARRMMEKSEEMLPLLERRVAIIDLQVGHLDMVRDVIETELAYRKDLTLGKLPEGKRRLSVPSLRAALIPRQNWIADVSSGGVSGPFFGGWIRLGILCDLPPEDTQTR